MPWLRDPLPLFVVLGAALACLHLALRDDAPALERDTLIVVTDADVAWASQVFLKTWNRPPTREELRNVVERRVRDEMLYREAVALGLDDGDPAVRRRLALKLAYLAKDVGGAAEPTDAELQAHIDADPERYAVEPRRRFSQVFVNTERRGAEAAGHARALLARLRAEPGSDLDQLGDTLLLERDQPSSTPRDVERQFGKRFADALFALDGDGWLGPIASDYGLHLVRVHERVDGGAAPLEQVRSRVRTDVVAARRDGALEAYVDALRKKYDVDLRTTLLEESAE